LVGRFGFRLQDCNEFSATINQCWRLAVKNQNQRARTTRRFNAQRARASLAWGLASFVLLQAALLAFIDDRMPELRDPEYGCKIVALRERLAEGPDRPVTIVMLGSSRTMFGLKGDRLEDPVSAEAGRRAVVFNFGTTGAGPFKNLMNLSRLLADGVRPDLLL